MVDFAKAGRSILIISAAAGLTACASIERRIAAQQGEPQEGSQATAPSRPAPEADLQTSSKAPAATRQPAAFQASSEYHFAMAQAYVAEGNPDRAIEEYKLAIDYDPKSALLRARLATEYVKKGMLSAAMEACKEALQRDPNFIDARLMLAGLYSTTHELTSALKEYDLVLKTDPRNEEAIVYKAQVLFEDQQGKEAIVALQKFIRKAPDSVLARYYLGRGFQRQGQTREAIAAYRAALAIRPQFSQAALGLGFLYEEKGNTQEALRIYQELYDLTQDPSAAGRLATLYLKAEKYREAVPYLESIQAADPDDMNVRVKIGLVYMELKAYDKAIAAFNSILAKNPDSDRIHYYLGSLYEETRDTAKAIEQLALIAPTSKLYADSALHIAYLLKQQGKMEDAKTQIAKAIDQSPKVPGLHMFQASLEEETKNLGKAVRILEGALSLFPEDEKLRYYLGSLYERQGNTDKSLDQMEAILALNPQNVDALNYIGYTWTQRGIRLNDAETLLRKAIGLRPDNGYIQDSWGYHLYVRGRVSEAVVELEKAARLKPNEATILEHLADAYARQNLREKALQKYRDAVRFAEDDDSRRKIEGKLNVIREELVRSGRIPADAFGEPTRSPAGTSSPIPATE